MESKNIYEISKNYWNKIPPTIFGMLGGFEHISTIDINSSRRFIKTLYKDRIINKSLDCGAGIGRVSKYLLLPLCNKIDLVESNETFLKEAKIYLNNDNKVEQYISSGLQSFNPTPDTYDLIWCQWVLAHLENNDLIEFLKKAKYALHQAQGEINTSKGSPSFIIVKENVTPANHIRDYDAIDGSITRPREEFLKIFKMAGLRILKEQVQLKFPPDLYKVIMFALY